MWTEGGMYEVIITRPNFHFSEYIECLHWALLALLILYVLGPLTWKSRSSDLTLGSLYLLLMTALLVSGLVFVAHYRGTADIHVVHVLSSLLVGAKVTHSLWGHG